jgi:uncharacterized integral membrane protein
MGKLGLILKWAILLPVVLAVLLLAVANDQSVPVHLNPFNAADPVLRAELPLYQLAFIIFILGTLAGAVTAWSGQRKYRRRVKQQREQVLLWQGRAQEAAPVGRPDPHSAAAAFLPRPGRG